MGSFRYGKENGKGKINFSNGSIFIGNFFSGKKDGPGVKITFKGKVYD